VFLSTNRCSDIQDNGILLQKGQKVRKQKHHFVLNPLNPKSDENEISLYKITVFSNIQVMRIEETVTKDKMS